MNNRLVIAALAFVCLFIYIEWLSVDNASAHGPNGNPILDLARCSARLTICQLPLAAPNQARTASSQGGAASNQVGTVDRHSCVDGIGLERSCALVGPFQYLSLLTDSIAVEVPELEVSPLDALGFTPCVGNFADRYPCQNVDLLSFLPLADIGGGNGSDIWGWTDPESGREYALVGHTRGVAFVDVTEPSAPLYLGDLPSFDGQRTLWRDLKVYAAHAFIVRDGGSNTSNHGVQIFDLRELRTVVNPPVTFETTAHYSLVNLAHNIAINEETGYAYVVGQRGGDFTCGAGLHMVDISTPAEPKFAGCFDEDGYTHDTQCVLYRGPDFAFQGKEICFNANEDTLTIVDVTHKQSPMLLSRSEYTSEEANQGLDQFYVHQGWLTEDHRYFLQDDEFDEAYNDDINTRTNIWDVSDLRNPQWVGFYDLGTTSSDHNLYIQGSHVYEANYSSGLRVLRIDEPSTASLVEVGYFDTTPENDNNGFDGGMWSVYPYFESGTVIASTMTEGLFVLAPQEPSEFTLIALDPHVLACNASNAQELIGTAQLPPFADAVGRVRLAAYNGYSGDVALSTASTASRGTVTLDNNLVTIVADTDTESPGQFELPVHVAQDWPTGTYTLTVSGTDGTKEAATDINVRIAAVKPATIDRLTAASLASAPRTFEFSWSLSAGAELYLIELAVDADFAQIVETAQSVDPGYQIRTLLALGQAYYWRVRAMNGCGETVSDTATFQTDPGIYMPIIH